jgi:hypothetical protein
VESLAQHEVHHPLIGLVAELQRRFLGQDIDALDRLSGSVGDFGEAGDAAAVQQHDRLPARAAIAARLRRELGQEVGHRADAVGTDFGRPQLLLGRDVADHRAGLRAAAGDDHVAFLAIIVGGSAGAGHGGLGGWRRLSPGGRGRLLGGQRCRRHAHQPDHRHTQLAHTHPFVSGP